jgi:hypothetical protein
MSNGFFDTSFPIFPELPDKAGSESRTIKQVPSERFVSQSYDVSSRTPNSVTIYPPIKSLHPTKSIPIMKALRRTASELQLVEDEEMADYRDYCMFTRIVNGINEQQHKNTETLNHIIQTRHLPVRDTPGSDQDDFMKYGIFPLKSASRITDRYSYEDAPVTIEEPEDYMHIEEEGVFVMDL